MKQALGTAGLRWYSAAHCGARNQRQPKSVSFPCTSAAGSADGRLVCYGVSWHTRRFDIAVHKSVSSANCSRNMQRVGHAHGCQQLVLRHRALRKELTSALGSQADNTVIAACDHRAPNFLKQYMSGAVRLMVCAKKAKERLQANTHTDLKPGFHAPCVGAVTDGACRRYFIYICFLAAEHCQLRSIRLCINFGHTKNNTEVLQVATVSVA